MNFCHRFFDYYQLFYRLLTTIDYYRSGPGSLTFSSVLYTTRLVYRYLYNVNRKWRFWPNLTYLRIYQDRSTGYAFRNDWARHATAPHTTSIVTHLSCCYFSVHTSNSLARKL